VNVVELWHTLRTPARNAHLGCGATGTLVANTQLVSVPCLSTPVALYLSVVRHHVVIVGSPSTRIGARENLTAIPNTAAAPPQQRTTSLRGEREGSRKGGAGVGGGGAGGGGPSAGAGTQGGRQVSEPQYTVYIRLPFDRNGFVNPPKVTPCVCQKALTIPKTDGLGCVERAVSLEAALEEQELGLRL